MSQCGKCEQRSGRYDDALQCSSSDCNRIFHIKCIGIAVEKFMQMKSSNEVNRWKCEDCKTATVIHNDSEKRLQSFIAAGFKDIKEEISDIKKSQIFIASQYDEMIKKIEEISSLKEKVEELEKTIEKKDKKIESMERRLTQLEQYSRNKNIEIRGLKKSPEEKIEDLVVKISEILKVKLNTEEIEACHRIPNQTGKEQAIIVQLKSRKKRDELLSKRKVTVTNQQLIGQGNGKVYIGENLSPYFKDLLWKTKQTLGEQYKFIWFWKDRILIKKDEQARAMIVFSEQDIEKISLGRQERKSL